MGDDVGSRRATRRVGRRVRVAGGGMGGSDGQFGVCGALETGLSIAV